jgi:hypothetical protein
MPLRLHPKRYVVAWTAAMTQIMESDRGGAFLSLWYIGSDDMTEPDERRVDRLRKLVDSFQTPADLEWRNIMADAIIIFAMVGPQRPQLAINTMLRRAALAGESAWARRVLLPGLIEIKQKRTLAA